MTGFVLTNLMNREQVYNKRVVHTSERVHLRLNDARLLPRKGCLAQHLHLKHIICIKCKIEYPGAEQYLMAKCSLEIFVTVFFGGLQLKMESYVGDTYFFANIESTHKIASHAINDCI